MIRADLFYFSKGFNHDDDFLKHTALISWYALFGCLLDGILCFQKQERNNNYPAFNEIWHETKCFMAF